MNGFPWLTVAGALPQLADGDDGTAHYARWARPNEPLRLFTRRLDHPA